MSITKLENKSLSAEDIYKITSGKAEIIAYCDLDKYKNCQELFKTGNLKILFFNEQNKSGGSIGHWEAVKKVGNTIQFFDSYGLAPDKCRSWLSKAQLIQLDEVKPELTRLFNLAHDDGYEILWNTTQYQSYKKDISTCGRWSSVFINNGDLRNNGFEKFISDLVRQYNCKTFDDAITKYTNEKYNI